VEGAIRKVLEKGDALTKGGDGCRSKGKAVKKKGERISVASTPNKLAQEQTGKTRRQRMDNWQERINGDDKQTNNNGTQINSNETQTSLNNQKGMSPLQTPKIGVGDSLRVLTRRDVTAIRKALRQFYTLPEDELEKSVTILINMAKSKQHSPRTRLAAVRGLMTMRRMNYEQALDLVKLAGEEGLEGDQIVRVRMPINGPNF